MTRFLLPTFLLALPLIEIAGFVLVGRQIGVLATIGLVVLSGLVGAVLLRWQGLGILSRVRREIDAGRSPGRELAHGAMVIVAAFLLMIPGFVTDIIGILLFIPPIRDLGWRFLRSRVRFVGSFASFGGRAARGDGQQRGPTIDLDADDYTSGPRPDSPWRRVDKP